MNLLALFWKEVLYTFFENVTSAAMFETSLLTTEFLATLALTSIYGVKEACIYSQ
jgi:hypothetical protein